jgi:D-serine deaminase-like pyridoxal phosphate-dependent protein
MSLGDPAKQCFLVEWYETGPAAIAGIDAASRLARAANALSTPGQPVALVVALSVPHDRTMFGVFSAAGADAVIQTCQHAGWPADRISTDVHAWLAPGLC